MTVQESSFAFVLFCILYQGIFYETPLEQHMTAVCNAIPVTYITPHHVLL